MSDITLTIEHVFYGSNRATQDGAENTKVETGCGTRTGRVPPETPNGEWKLPPERGVNTGRWCIGCSKNTQGAETQALDASAHSVSLGEVLGREGTNG
jgi:hypothetical protein